MKKKQLKHMIKKSYVDNTPDFLTNIKSKCEQTIQKEPSTTSVEVKDKRPISFFVKRIGFAMSLCLVFVVGILIGNIKPKEAEIEKLASIYLDVNPSIEIDIDKDNNVISCTALNDDGNEILTNLNLNGVNIDIAIYAVVGAMYTNGYLNLETNSILVSVDQKDSSTELITNICEQIESIFVENEDMSCSIIAQNIKSNKDLVDKAKEYDISVGKMKLVEKITSKSEIYTEDNLDELTHMSIHELDLIYQSIDKNEVDQNEIISGKPNSFIEKDEALNLVLEYLSLTKDDIVYDYVLTLYDVNENFQVDLLYHVTIRLKSTFEKVSYVVNCTTGEIEEENIIEDWLDKIPNFGNNGEHNNKGDKDDSDSPGNRK